MLKNYKKWILVIIYNLFGLLAGVYIFSSNKTSIISKQNEQLEKIIFEINEKLNTYGTILRSGRALFISSSEVTRVEWKNYIENHDIENLYPGIQGLGYSKVVKPSEISLFEKKVQSEGFPNFKLTPEGERDTYTSVLYLEPFDIRNQKAFGFDMFSEEIRKEAMIRSRNNNSIAMTDIVTLLQETEQDKQPGFLLYLPHYSKDVNLNSLESKQNELLGYIYAPFRAHDFFNSVMNGITTDLTFKIYSGKTVDEAKLLYSYNSKKFDNSTSLRTIKSLENYGQSWTIVTKAENVLDAHLYELYIQPILTFLVFFVISLLTMQITLIADKTKMKAESETNIKIDELNKTLDKYKAILNNSINSIIVFNSNGIILSAFNNTQISNLTKHLYKEESNIEEYYSYFDEGNRNKYLNDPLTKNSIVDITQDFKKSVNSIEGINIFLASTEVNGEMVLILYICKNDVQTFDNKDYEEQIVKLNSILIDRENRMAELKNEIQKLKGEETNAQ